MDSTTSSPTTVPLTSPTSRAEYWDTYYARSGSSGLPVPSQFAVFVAGELGGPHRVVDVGCGNGRDSLFFLLHGHQVVGIDASQVAIERCRDRADQLALGGDFVRASILEPRFAELLPDGDLPTAVYARFFLHAITDEEEAAFLSSIRDFTRPGDVVALEYRSVRDVSLEKVTGQHYRRYVDPARFNADLVKHGFTITYAVEGFGFAKYKNDDAYVARVCLTRD
ncbi:Methyltransferase type 12 [Beutenbergia cavernae DSM 12333]|uniref:Methyltransferase type 12 n=1 Tax=Beutenbergia cavernae (strain ATCC BAA-8 / DSM 12333 / CCUG 43141 / JCM 11478 / NBRC 16432 / NCIMB 13614 / HKI 0122) TaxID=471853 RepID=C5C157_BEUC1|nr:class I SAM-dependent methyltransferase [Beutenbergia cavernae]ACQ79461.1 Methyltransferase type 12 [Beutenbergia cavernae DSM 12333]